MSDPTTCDGEQNIYKPSKDFSYNPEIPAQKHNYVRAFLNNRVGGKPNEISNLTRYTAVLEKNVIRKKKTGTTRKKRKLLTSKEKRQLGIFNVHKEKLSYTSFVPIHAMWKDYFRGIVGDDGNPDQARLLKAEYSGCFLAVAESKCPSYVGTRGIVVQETKNVFRLITEDDRVKTVPKAHSLFAFELDGKVYRIYGSYFRVHSFQRMKSKFKTRGIVEL